MHPLSVVVSDWTGNGSDVASAPANPDWSLKLLDRIEGYESGDKSSRDYWLKLYDQCLQAVKGYDLESVLRAR